jgi:phage-related minor tail protein
MANGRIKGITVEIDGNTTKLTDALKKVNSQVSRTESALKDVNKLLKLDPTNTELLRQKQQLLGEAVTATKDKLAELRGASQKAREQMESGDLGEAQYQAIQREIADTERKLKELEEQAKQAGATLGNSMQDAGEKIKKTGKSISETGDKITGVGKTLTTSITAPIAAAGVAAVKFASDYEENLNKVDASFKKNAQEVKDWAKTATENFGMSESAALEATSLFGDMGTSMGLTTKEAADMSTSLAGLAGDLSSFKNIGIDEAMTALKGVFTGETESLKTLGIVMTETNLKQFASDCGLVYDGMSQAEKVTLRYKYVLSQTKNAQGDYKATSDGTANSLRTLQSEAKNLSAAFGEEILPTITPLIQKTTELVKGFGELDDSEKKSIIQAAAVAAAIGPVTTAVGTATSGIGKLVQGTGSAVIGAGKFVAALEGGGGLATALTATLGSAGAAGLAVAGAAAATAGAIALGNAIHNATDPTIQIKKHLEDMSKAQERLSENQNVVDLANRYEELQKKTQDSTLTAEEYAAVQDELAEVRAALAEATNGAIAAEGEYNDSLDETVKTQKELAQAEADRADSDIYAELVKGAKDYQKSLKEQREIQDKITKAKDRVTDAENRLQDATRQSTAEIKKNGKATTSTNIELQDAAVCLEGARDSYDDLQGSLDEARAVTDQYEQSLIGLVNDGYLPAEDAAALLGVSEDTLGRKMTAQWNEAHKAELANNSLAEEHLEAAEAAQEQATAEETATTSLAKVGVAAYDALNAGGDLSAAYEELSKQAEQYTEDADAQVTADTERALKMLELAATTQELGKEYGNMADSIGVSTSAVAGYLIDAGMSVDDFNSKVTDATDSVVNDFEKAETSLDMSLSDMASNLQANIEAQENWNANMETLWNRAVASGDSGTMALVQQLYDMGLKGAAQVAQFVDLTDAELAEWGSKFQAAGQNATEKAVLGAAMSAGTLYDSGAAMGQSAVDGYSSTDMTSKGAESGSELAAGIAAQAPAVEDAAQELGMAAHSAIAQIKWTDLGDAVAQGISNGLKSGAGDVQKAGAELADALKTSWSSSGGEFQAAGTEAGTKIKVGLLLQSNSVQTAGRKLATDVTNVWTTTAGRFRQSGQSAGNQIKTGLAGQSNNIRSTAKQQATSINTVWGSMSGTFRQSGVSAAGAVSGGITAGTATVAGAAAAAAYAAKNAMQIGGWNTLGYNISAGVAYGINSGSGLISRAARNAAQKALNSAKSSLGIHSPSKVFRDQVGAMIPAGMVEGIKAKAKDVSKAVGTLGGNLSGSLGVPVSGGSRTTNFSPVVNVYGTSGQNVNELADVVVSRINHMFTQRAGGLN